jgi:hypothetical protein
MKSNENSRYHLEHPGPLEGWPRPDQSQLYNNMQLHSKHCTSMKCVCCLFEHIERELKNIKKRNPCCSIMENQLNYKCDEHNLECPDIVVKYDDDYEKYTLHSANAEYECNFCPWCGKKLEINNEGSE